MEPPQPFGRLGTRRRIGKHIHALPGHRPSACSAPTRMRTIATASVFCVAWLRCAERALSSSGTIPRSTLVRNGGRRSAISSRAHTSYCCLSAPISSTPTSATARKWQGRCRDTTRGQPSSFPSWRAERTGQARPSASCKSFPPVRGPLPSGSPWTRGSQTWLSGSDGHSSPTTWRRSPRRGRSSTVGGKLTSRASGCVGGRLMAVRRRREVPRTGRRSLGTDRRLHIPLARDAITRAAGRPRWRSRSWPC